MQGGWAKQSTWGDMDENTEIKRGSLHTELSYSPQAFYQQIHGYARAQAHTRTWSTQSYFTESIITPGTSAWKKTRHTHSACRILSELEPPCSSPDLLQPLKVISQLLVDGLGRDLGSLAGLPIFLPVEEPVGDLELTRVLDDGHELLDLVGGHLSSPS